MNTLRWRSVRRFIRRARQPSGHRSYLEQAEYLLNVAGAFDARWPLDRCGVERRMVWLGLTAERAYYLSDIVHLLDSRPHRRTLVTERRLRDRLV